MTVTVGGTPTPTRTNSQSQRTRPFDERRNDITVKQEEDGGGPPGAAAATAVVAVGQTESEVPADSGSGTDININNNTAEDDDDAEDDGGGLISGSGIDIDTDNYDSSSNSNDQNDTNQNSSSSSSNNNKSGTNSSTKSLAFPVGMGQRLPSLQKEGLFVRSWKETLDNISFEDEDGGADESGVSSSNSSSSSDTTKSFIQKMSQRLETLRLRDVHDMVHKHRITLVHGDFHVANFLWPSLQSSTTTATATATDTDDSESTTRPYVVDWATCGYGNPLVDFVFFLVVSTNNNCVSNVYGWLRKYYDLLLKYNPNLRSTLTVETLKEMMMPALLCQWLILVSYDAMCRQIALSEANETKCEMTSRHFNNVNLRTVLAMKSLDGWDKLLNEIPKTNDAERLEAQDFCVKTPLEI